MQPDELRALESLRFDFAQVPDDVWRNSPYHVDELHAEVMREIASGIQDAARSRDASPIGVAVQGHRGVGKTHLLGLVRAHTHAAGGYFFLVNPHDGAHFWETVAQTMVQGLFRQLPDSGQQLTTLLDRLTTTARALDGVREAIVGDAPLTPSALSSFIASLRRHDPQVGLECQDTARALVLLGAQDLELQDIGFAYLQSGEGDHDERSVWGFRSRAKLPQQVVKELSALLALTGPSVIAVDQIDALVAQSVKAPTRASADGEVGECELLLEQIADGLMTLREITRRTLTVVSCLPDTWILINEKAVATVTGRFRQALQLHRIPSPEAGRAIIERRFTERYKEIGFHPPYPTWPVADSAFTDAMDFTPRSLLQRVDAHIRACLRRGVVTELTNLLDSPPEKAPPPVSTTSSDHLQALDTQFAKLRSTAEISSALDPDTEDEEMPALLSAALTAWITEQGSTAGEYAQDPPPGRKPALHARLRRTLDDRTEDERHWAFRALGHSHPRAVQCRIRNASTMAGLGTDPTKRKLILLRNQPWPSGRVTRDVVEAFRKAGGEVVPVSEEDLRTFAALRVLLADRNEHVHSWLLSRRPASNSTLLATVLADDAESAAQQPGTMPVPRQGVAPLESVSRGQIPIGTSPATGHAICVAMEALRRHTVIFAGSGSGKTVLIRRIVEECALRGVSAIVLDPNNDLARLGDAWPQPPAGWGPGDEERAREYLAHTDVVVWTPRKGAGRPLAFQPLPDLQGVLDDPDEFHEAIEAAVAALAPRAKVDGKTTKAAQGQAVLKQTLAYFARHGGVGLRSYLDLLTDLPQGVSDLARASHIAAELAETLKAAIINDPLFGGDGTPVDPGLLLRPSPGKRARVSVISLVGLPAEEQRQSFVNQLQLALFAWIKKHPATDRPLGGLFVMDEAQTLAPATGLTACTQSTLALVSQARKYGLGLVFATQAPRGLHNGVAGNAATQFFGLLNAPAQTSAAQEIARAKGAAAPDISRLGTGEFYVGGPDLPFQKVHTPLCLSHHPASPLTAEEVIARARGREAESRTG